MAGDEAPTEGFQAGKRHVNICTSRKITLMARIAERYRSKGRQDH